MWSVEYRSSLQCEALDSEGLNEIMAEARERWKDLRSTESRLAEGGGEVEKIGIFITLESRYNVDLILVWARQTNRPRAQCATSNRCHCSTPYGPGGGDVHVVPSSNQRQREAKVESAPVDMIG